jgi:hypothetical protein
MLERIMTNSKLKSKPDYGFDGSPFIVAIVCFAGVVCFGGGVALITFPSLSFKIAGFILIRIWGQVSSIDNEFGIRKRCQSLHTSGGSLTS